MASRTGDNNRQQRGKSTKADDAKQHGDQQHNHPSTDGNPRAGGKGGSAYDDVKDNDEDHDEGDNDDVQVGREVASSGGDSPEEHEKEERRRTAQRVLLKQG